MDPNLFPQFDQGDDLDRALRRAQAEKRSDRFYLGGVGLGAMLAVIGAVVAVSGGPAWMLVAGFGGGILVAYVLATIGRRQLDYDPSGEIDPPPPEGLPPEKPPEA